MQSELIPFRSMSHMRSFHMIPEGHNVIAFDGMPVVYVEHPFADCDLENGAFYVVEYQRPVAGMAWDTFFRTQSSRLEIERAVVRAERCRKNPDLWWLAHALADWRSGPTVAFEITNIVIGRVVGFYDPNPVHGGKTPVDAVLIDVAPRMAANA